MEMVKAFSPLANHLTFNSITMYNVLNAFARWLYRKTMPQALLGRQWTGTNYVDNYKRTRNPTPNELLAELKGAAWTCISMNASVCAGYPPQLFVTTEPGQAQPRCATRSIGRAEMQAHQIVAVPFAQDQVGGPDPAGDRASAVDAAAARQPGAQ